MIMAKRSCEEKCELFQADKENDVPRKKRKPNKKRLQTGNDKFKAELENLDELDDPFDVYDRYIKWTMENYSQASGSHSRLRQILERASYTFVNDIRYKNDPRYLRCWIQYSKHVENLKELFTFLNRNGIGLDLATYYEEYAQATEAMKCYKETKKIFETGISRRAQPLMRLNKRYNQFLERMTLIDISFNTCTAPTPKQLNPQTTIIGSTSSTLAIKEKDNREAEQWKGMTFPQYKKVQFPSATEKDSIINLSEPDSSILTRQICEIIERKEAEKQNIIEIMNNEKLKIVERKESEKLEIVERKEAEKQQLIHGLEKALRLERVCNVRGALEYVRSQIRLNNNPTSFVNPVDTILFGLTQDKSFTNFLRHTCVDNYIRFEDVKTCLGGLYHNVSKHFHGHNEVIIDSQSWAANEILSLGVIFFYFKVPFTYYDDGIQSNFPFKIPAPPQFVQIPLPHS